jgi:hypothetical protein
VRNATSTGYELVDYREHRVNIRILEAQERNEYSRICTKIKNRSYAWVRACLLIDVR